MTPVRYRDPKWILLAAAAVLACAGLARGATDSGSGVVYRWVDSAGVVHYGDRIPPQYAQKATTVLNDDGVVIGQLSAEQSPSELAQSAREQQARLEQKRRDTFLLTTYTSVADIEQLRDQRIGQIRGQRAAAEQYIGNLNAQLRALEARAMLYKPYNPDTSAHRMPDDLVEQLVRTMNELRTQNAGLAAKGRQEAAIRSEFQADIDRYRELRHSQDGDR
ncbi:MAG: DUF4124 domain-containing protein [Steroidobacteraceae bacterium]